jgi:MFS family permease
MSRAAVVAALAIMYFGSAIPTPLLEVYRQRYHLPEIVLGLIFCAYVGGTLASLALFGRLSDQIGRRPTGFIAVAVAAVSTILFVVAEGTALLYVARILSGVSVGLFAGSANAWLAELFPKQRRADASWLAAIANMTGLGLGPAAAGLLAQYAPQPLALPYVAFLVLVAAAAAAIWLSRETVARPAKPLGDLSLSPRFGVPPDLLLPFLAPALTAFSIFSVTGFFGAIAPTLVAKELHLRNHAVGGAIVAEFFLAAALFLLPIRRLSSRTAMLTGLVILVPGLALLVLADRMKSLPVLLVATAIGGAGVAFGYRGSLEQINAIAPDDRRAEMVSSYFLPCYAGVSLPVIGVAALAQLTDIPRADAAFAAVIAALAIVALAIGSRYAKAA